MASMHARGGTLAGALALCLLGLLSSRGAAQVIETPEKCATPAVLQPPAATTRVPVDAGGLDGNRTRYPGLVVPVALGVPAEAPRGATAGSARPVAATPSTTQTSPPTATPPALPGLVPARTEDDDEDRPHVAAIQAQGEVPEERLLDVGIEIFGPGVEEEDRAKLSKVGLSPEIRRSEARYIAYHLRKTLEGTGNWGAVRVIPGAAEGLDLTVTGTILESNGKRLTLEVEARDALGRRWLRKRYRGQADLAAYRADAGSRPEAFQDLYNRIANDLLHARDGYEGEELVVVRRVATLRFAAQLAPQTFDPFLKSDKDGRFTLVRFPAEGDPMMRRISSIRERDLMFVDTLNDYYLGFYDRMSGPYADWKKYSYEEQDALDRITKQSRLKKILGGVAVLVGAMIPRNSQGADMAGDAMIMGGMIAVQSGFQQGAQKGIHETALKELATSFDADTTPLLVEVEGQQRQLSGSAEAQFVAWRDLLRQIFSLETGAPDDPNGMVVAGPPSTP